MGWSSVRRQHSLLQGPWGHTGERAPGSMGVCGEGERKSMGDGNEGANCFQWILKSNPGPQCMGLAARKWNIDDYGENKGK